MANHLWPNMPLTHQASTYTKPVCSVAVLHTMTVNVAREMHVIFNSYLLYASE